MNFTSYLRNNIKSIDINLSEKFDRIELVDYIEKEKIEAIFIIENFGDKIVTDIDFLKGITTKQNIKELHIMVQILNCSVVYDFNGLYELTLCNHSKNAIILELMLLPKLNKLGLNGSFIINSLDNSRLQKLIINRLDTFKITSTCDALEDLELSGSNSFSLDQARFLPNLKKIVLTQLRLVNFNGIENLKKLENLTIHYCSKLKDISQINSCSNLKKLEFDTCKKIENFESLATLMQLQGLVISNCGSIPSLRFIKQMSGLKFLSFVNTNIIDGDLTECLRLENVGTLDKKHYNIKAKDLPKNKNYAFWKL